MSATPTKIMVMDEKGETWVSTQTYERLLERIDFLEKTVNKLWDEKYAIERRLEILEKPIRQKQIVDLLVKENVPRSWRWIQNRLIVLDSDLTDLIRDQKIIRVKHGYTNLYLINKKEA